MTKQLNEQILYWKTTAGRNWETACSLFKLKHYDACLFFCHLAIEKMLKGLVVKKTKQAAPYIHHLEKLAKLAELKLTEEQIENLMSRQYDNVLVEQFRNVLP